MSSRTVRLSGRVQIDRIVLGSPEDPMFRGRWKTPVVLLIATEIDGSVVGKMRMQLLTGVSPNESLIFCEEVLAPGAIVETPFSSGLLSGITYSVQTQHLEPTVPVHNASTCLAGVDYVASALKRWLRRTYCAAVDLDRLSFYLDEFTFRANFRRDINRGEFFELLLRQALGWKPGNAESGERQEAALAAAALAAAAD